MKINKVLLLFILAGSSIIACKTKEGKFEFIHPESGETVLKGEKIQLKLNFPNTTMDSVIYSVDGDTFESKTDTSSVVFDTDKFGFGKRRLSAKVSYSGKEDVTYIDIIIVPPVPKQYTFEVINTFPHDSLAFTQGLEYKNGYLYESTGMNGRSSLRKVELNTGKVLHKIDINEQYFGEGMTIIGEKIIMLTWKSGIGFVFNKSTFNLIQTFNYKSSAREGWGITYDGKQLIQSDGSSYLIFIDPVTFKEMDSIQIFDDNGLVDKINELEYIDEKVYANLYHADRDEVIIIDPVKGIVEGRINFIGLYDGVRQSPSGNEMNGIAYNKDTGNLYVTGKDWTKLYEVKIKER